MAHLVGALGEAPSRGRHAWVGLDDHSLAPDAAPELLADVYAVAGGPWVEDGYLTHIVVVPADGPLPALFFGLGFGQEQVHATRRRRSLRRRPSPTGSRSARRRRRTSSASSTSRARSPAIRPAPRSGPDCRSRSGRRCARAGWNCSPRRARSSCSPSATARRSATSATYADDEPGVAHLPVAGTRSDVRGAGIGVALVEHALHRAHGDGVHTVALDWRSTNLLASRFWPTRGFVPTHLRLRRDVQPTA